MYSYYLEAPNRSISSIIPSYLWHLYRYDGVTDTEELYVESDKTYQSEDEAIGAGMRWCQNHQINPQVVFLEEYPR